MQAVAERQDAAREIQLQASLLDAAPAALVGADLDGVVTHWTRGAQALYGWTNAQAIGWTMAGLMVGPEAEAAAEEILAATREKGYWEGEIEAHRSDGSRFPAHVRNVLFTDSEGRPAGLVSVSVDISDRIASARQLSTAHSCLRAANASLEVEVESLSWVARIRDALAEDRMVLFAQPIINLATGRLAQNELLIRMVDSGGGVIVPGEFLPAAEQYGLITDIDRWVAHQAFELAGDGHSIAFNLSAHSLAAPGLVDEFRAELDRTSADPSLVIIELTETAIVDDEHAAALFMEGVSALGCKLALDDFGTGYGGFSYLKRLPVDCLKIDMEFVRDLVANEASQHVVKAIVSLARDFGQETVAEGAPDDPTLRMLGNLGVDHAQGFGIGWPLPLAEVLETGFVGRTRL